MAMAFLAPSLPAAAQQAQGGTPPAAVVLVIDLQEIYQKAKAAQGVRAEREKLAQSYQAEFSKEEDALRKAEQDLLKQRSLLSPEAFAEKARAFEQQAGSFQRRVNERREALERSFGTAMNQVQDGLIKVMDEIATQKGANMILFRSQTFLFDPAMDATDLAIERLNATLPSVAFPTPQTPAQ
ncbi:OmpH family outer membrane protein [Telmatospirillum sp. J64-1]|uniref:OmpH family outer membrane protein n=1 Tax=Telmatospirillum sp. J64-1 TaxID=2502183 RepID=UPI00163DD5BE|nr:OmpH family outer membrane protein [Telmatospirillum sp. J64-1]